MEKRAKKFGTLRAERDQMRRRLKRVKRLQAEMQEIIGEARERLGLDELEGEFGYALDEDVWAFVDAPAPPPPAPPEDAKKKPEPPKTGAERRRELEAEAEKAASDEPAPVAAAPELQVLAGAGANGGGQ